MHGEAIIIISIHGSRTLTCLVVMHSLVALQDTVNQWCHVLSEPIEGRRRALLLSEAVEADFGPTL